MNSNLPVKVLDITESLGKLPPQAVDLEESVLGAILLDKNAIVEVASVLRKEMFYTEQHQEIYAAIQELFSEANPIDMRTVVARLRKNGKLEIVGGAYYIAELTSKIASAANIVYHSAILVEMAMKRELIQMASEVHHDSYEDTSDVFEVVAKTNLRLQEIQDHAISAKGDKSIVDICFELMKEIESRQSGVTMGLPTGYKSVDQILNGFIRTDLIIVAARPGMGKTSWAMQAGLNIAKNGNPIGVFSLEMPSKRLVERIAASEAEIDSHKIKKGILDRYEQERLNNYIGDISKLPIHIDDSPFLTIIELRARAMRMKTKYGIKLIIIDYLQLLKGVTESGRQTTRDQEIGSITRTLKGIAKELDVPVIALAQLSRSVETRGGLKRPMLSDLRESGCISGDSKIHHLKGITRISNLDGVKKIDTFAFMDSEIKEMKAKKCWSTGYKKVLELSLTTGHTIIATPNHKFYTSEGWLRLDQISPDQLIAIPINYNGNSKDYNVDVAYLIGSMLANGKMIKRQPLTYTCNSEDLCLAQELKRITEENFECEVRIVDNRPKYNWLNAYIKSKRKVSKNYRNPFVVFIEEQGIYDLRAKNKCVPNSMFQQSKKTIISFLAGLFDNDGSIWLVKSKTRTTPAIHYSSASKEFIDGIQLLLQMVGIISRVKLLSNGNQQWYNLSVTGKENILLFCEKIPLKSIRKQDEITKIIHHLSSIKAGWIKHYTNESKTLAFIQINSITPLEEKVKVFDMEVPKASNFIANGILVHNSIEQDADVVAFLYRPEYYKIQHDEDGFSTHGLCEVIIEKHRDGSLGTAKMKFIGKYTKFIEWISEPQQPVTTKRQEFGTAHYKNPTEKLPTDDDQPF